MAKTVIISDLHIDRFSPEREKAFSHFLEYVGKTASRLIINGDILDFPPVDGEELKDKDKRILVDLLGLRSSGVEIVYLPGNHDIALRGLPFTTRNMRVTYPRFVFETGGKRVYVEHGHYYDPLFSGGYDILEGIRKMTGYDVGRIAVDTWKAATRFLQRVTAKGQTNEVGVQNSRFLTGWEDKAKELHREGGYDYVVFGHTHHPQLPSDGGCYINTGDWVTHSTVTEFDEHGNASQREWLVEGMTQVAATSES